MSYDGYLTEGCDTGLDGPFVCEPCYEGRCELCEPEQCECECREVTRHREVALTLPKPSEGKSWRVYGTTIGGVSVPNKSNNTLESREK